MNTSLQEAGDARKRDNGEGSIVSFVNPLFLIGLSAALLPVLYHLIRRIQAKRVPFSSLAFLTAANKQVVRKKRLRDILLMLVRSALFALLALAFARPFFSEPVLPQATSRQARSVVFLLDNSFSMLYGDRFERARREIERRMSAGGPADEYALLVFSDKVETLSGWTRDRTLVTGILNGRVNAGYRPTRFYNALRSASDLFKEAGNPERELILVSDLQKNGWSASFDNWSLPGGITFVPVNVDTEKADNLFIDALNISSRLRGEETTIRFETRVGTSDPAHRTTRQLNLESEGKPIGRQEVDVAGPTRVSFTEVTDRQGYHQGMLSLAGDRLTADDRFYFTYPVQPRPAVRCATGEMSGRGCFYLEKAFTAGDDLPYSFVSGSSGQLSRGDLRDADLLILSDVASISGDQASTITRFVEEGGTLLLSFGDQSARSGASTLLTRFGLGTARNSSREENPETPDPAIIGEVDLHHPVFDVLSSSASSVILYPSFRRYVSVQADTSAHVIGRYDTGDPFLIEKPLGRGKILVYTSSFETRWTDFPLQEMFVPFVYQLARYAHRETDDGSNYRVGEPVPLESRPGATWEVRAPGDRIYRVTTGDDGKAAFLETEVPGHYTASTAGTTVRFSVNVDPTESILEARDIEEVRMAVSGPGNDRTPAGPVQVTTRTEQKQELWKYLLLAVVALLMLETFLANRKPSVLTYRARSRVNGTPKERTVSSSFDRTPVT